MTNHITTNFGRGSVTLCGAVKKFTYAGIADGTNDHYTDRYFIGPERFYCPACVAEHHKLPPAELPAVFR